MEQINLQLHFLQTVYRLRENTDSIVTTVQAWLNNEETTAHQREMLSKSFVAWKLVADLQFMLSDLAITLRHYVEDDQNLQVLEAIGKDSYESRYGDTGGSCRTPDCYISELKRLEQAAQIATKMLMDLFEHYFFLLPSDSLIDIPGEDMIDLSRLNRDLSDERCLLEGLLGDVELVIKTMN